MHQINYWLKFVWAQRVAKVSQEGASALLFNARDRDGLEPFTDRRPAVYHKAINCSHKYKPVTVTICMKCRE